MFCIMVMPGCAARHYNAVREAVKTQEIPALSSATGYTFTFPESAEAQRYSTVELLQNVYVEMAEGAKVCSFVLGKCRAHGCWEVVSASMRREDGGWHELDVRSKAHGDKVALGL